MRIATWGSVNARNPRSCKRRLPAGKGDGVASAMGFSGVRPPEVSLRKRMRSYWIPGSYAPTLSEERHAFLRPLTKKGYTEERVITIGWYDIGKSTTLESNKSHLPS